MKIENNSTSFGMALRMPSKSKITKILAPDSARELESCRKVLKSFAKDVDIKLDLVKNSIPELHTAKITITPIYKNPIKKILNILQSKKNSFVSEQYVNCGIDISGRVISTAELGKHQVLSKLQ